MAAAVESWDEDVDFQGDLFTHSVSTVQTSLSSRLSVHSESNFGEDDWEVSLKPNDSLSTDNAILTAKQAGVPIPSNIPPSALLGGTIKRLGKKTSRQKLEDAWGDDLDFAAEGGLTLKPKKLAVVKDEFEEERDDFDEWTEGSLGIRLAGSRKDARNRSSSASAMSPSLGSVTAESEDDDFRGLELPEGPVDLETRLKQQQAAHAAQQPEQEIKLEQPTARTTVKSPLLEEHDDFLDDLEVGGGEVFDPKKLTLHKNIKQKLKSGTTSSARAPLTSLTFTEKPVATSATRIPRPVTGAKPASRLEPVFETGASQVSRPARPQPTTTGAQLLRSKRSMPLLNRNQPLPPRPPVPFLPANAQSHHITARGSASHLRRESDPNRPQSPPPRSFSRLSNAYIPETPSRTSRRPDLASRELVREAATKKTLTKPQRRRVFGDGTELEVFDDLPTSVTKEAKFVKQPSTRVAPKSLRHIPSRLDIRESGLPSRMSIPERMMTPLPGPITPKSPLKVFQEPSNTPRYLRDTAASRIARESRTAATTTASRPRSDGPLMPVNTNWKAQVAARSPFTSPSAPKLKGKRVQPGLIKPSDAAVIKSTWNCELQIMCVADFFSGEKGMTFNPITHRWEGNENSLRVFDFPPSLPTPTPLSHGHTQPKSYLSHHQPAQTQAPPPSPPRPALIAPMSAASNQNIQVVGGMVFDPVRMCWLKFKAGENQPLRGPSNPKSPSATDNEDDEDPFAGIDDLKENKDASGTSGDAATAGGKTGLATDEWLVGEEFDMGPEFIRRQKEEEVLWRKKCEAWFVGSGDAESRSQNSDWRWRIREIAGAML